MLKIFTLMKINIGDILFDFQILRKSFSFLVGVELGGYNPFLLLNNWSWLNTGIVSLLHSSYEVFIGNFLFEESASFFLIMGNSNNLSMTNFFKI